MAETLGAVNWSVLLPAGYVAGEVGDVRSIGPGVEHEPEAVSVMMSELVRARPVTASGALLTSADMVLATAVMRGTVPRQRVGRSTKSCTQNRTVAQEWARRTHWP